MSWPEDGGPRFIVDERPTVRVLDRATAFTVVAAYKTGRRAIEEATREADSRNAADEADPVHVGEEVCA